MLDDTEMPELSMSLSASGKERGRRFRICAHEERRRVPFFVQRNRVGHSENDVRIQKTLRIECAL